MKIKRKGRIVYGVCQVSRTTKKPWPPIILLLTNSKAVNASVITPINRHAKKWMLCADKHDTMKQSWGNVGPESQTLAQHYPSTVLSSRVSWDAGADDVREEQKWRVAEDGRLHLLGILCQQVHTGDEQDIPVTLALWIRRWIRVAQTLAVLWREGVEGHKPDHRRGYAADKLLGKGR